MPKYAAAHSDRTSEKERLVGGIHRTQAKARDLTRNAGAGTDSTGLYLTARAFPSSSLHTHTYTCTSYASTRARKWEWSGRSVRKSKFPSLCESQAASLRSFPTAPRKRGSPEGDAQMHARTPTTQCHPAVPVLSKSRVVTVEGSVYGEKGRLYPQTLFEPTEAILQTR